MKIRRLLKWTVRGLLVVFLALTGWGVISYWRSTNDCDRKTGAPANPMKAIRYCEYGSPDVLKFEDVEKPVPNDDQVLIKVRAASLNFIDPGLMRGPFLLRLMLGSGLRKPEKTRLGNDLAGQVEAVGKNVTKFKPGDEVFGVGRPTLAEYACARERGLVIKPANVTFEQAGCVAWAGFTALQGLQTGKIKAGTKSLDQRCIGRRRHVCGSNCESFRRGSHGAYAARAKSTLSDQSAQITSLITPKRISPKATNVTT